MPQSTTVLLLAAALLTGAQAKDKKKTPPAPPRDGIEVAAHIPAAGSPITRFIPTHHYSSNYLYVEHADGKTLTLIDVTSPAQAHVLADVPSSPGANVFAVAGTAVLVAADTANAPSQPQSVRILDLSDPQQPKVAREFTGVTALSRDDARGLIFVAAADGIWILHQNFATDPEVEKEYARHVIYDH